MDWIEIFQKKIWFDFIIMLANPNIVNVLEVSFLKQFWNDSLSEKLGIISANNLYIGELGWFRKYPLKLMSERNTSNITNT